MTYLFWLVSALTIIPTHVGFVLTSNTEVGSELAKQFDWKEEATEWNTAISSISIFGLIIGSFTAIFFVRKGRRNTIIWMSFVGIIGIIPTLFLNIWLILAGKLIYGFSAGVMIVAASLYLQETVPAVKSATFDFTTNFGVILGITINLVAGFALP